MAGLIYLALPLCLLLLFLLVQRRRTRLVADHAAYPGLVTLDRATTRARGIGVGIATAAGITTGFLGSYGRGLFQVPLVFALVLVLCLDVAEVLVWRSARTPGQASLESRRARSYLPVGLTLGVLSLLGFISVAFQWCRRHQNTTVGDYGERIGTQYVWTSADGRSSASGGPFPGTYYSIPAAWLLAALTLAVLVGIALVTLRPRNGADPVVVAVDDGTRHRSLEAILASAMVGLLGTFVFLLIGASTGAAQILLGRDWDSRLDLLGLALVAGAMALGAWAGSLVLVPGRAREVPA
ncbi:MAG: hypothetical protein L0G49_11535 [Luteococcus sp.]|uniref:hypothetical protein n=1 Tax=Luteococcus sp. TaxID=1969402 RepID=UPI002649820E|nr:hypothetical protein [Luteococcus sp.]MDN5564381.1 hypothetical protein [Luteococcus sp.]